MSINITKEDPNINITALLELLNVKPDDILQIDEFYVNSKQIDFYVTLRPKATFCPECGTTNIIKKEWKVKKVIHKVYDDKKSIIYIKYCRYKCKECGKTFSEVNPISLKGQNISMKIVYRVLEELVSLNATYDKTAKRLGISNTTVTNIIDRYLSIKEKPLPKVMCIDEIYVTPEDNHPYACVLLDHQTGTLIDVIKGREKVRLNNYFLSKKPAELENVKYITMDMWEPYLDVAKRCFPQAIVAIDSFHVMEHFNKAIHDIRCQELKKYDEKSIQFYVLKKVRKLLTQTKELSLEKEWNRKLKQFICEQDLVNLALSFSDALSIAYNFYHSYRFFNHNSTYEDANERLDNLLSDTTQLIKIKELKDIVIMLQNWKPWIINSFLFIEGRRLSNGPMEGTNSRLKKIKKTMTKVDNFERYRKRCMLSINEEIKICYAKKNTVRRKGNKRGKYKKKKSQS